MTTGQAQLNSESSFEARAIAAIRKLKLRIRELEESAAERIAVVGISCRFPGGCNSPREYWAALREGRDLTQEIPLDRFDVNEHYDSDVDAPGKLNSRRGGFLDAIDRFDAKFFGMSPREANQLDPQQRLLLQVAWEACEHAGLTARELSGSRTGVFCGMVSVDYLHNQMANWRHVDAHGALGAEPGFAAGRLSYLLNLRGPSLVFNTLCSSSFAALHSACASLRRGECDRAIVGGVNTISWAPQSVLTSKCRVLSPTGRCRVFDAAADGFVRSEGCGVIVLRRLSQAQRDRESVLAVIRGTAINHDGRGIGFTAPNGRAQEDVMRAALKDAGLNPGDISYVEAHGTGTVLGDPIEADSIAAVYGAAGVSRCALGAVKANVGHTEAAAGMAGLIKAVLMLQHREVPPVANFSKLNPRINFSGSRLYIPTTLEPWEASTGTARVGVSSFGMSGSNGHAILEEAPAIEELRREQLGRDKQIVCISAATRPALQALAGRYADHLSENGRISLGDLAYSANERRNRFEQRLCWVGEDSAAFLEVLREFSANGVITSSGCFQNIAVTRPRIAYMFTGQGAQYVGMGGRLYQCEPVFRETVDRCADAIHSSHGIDVRKLMWNSSDDALADTRFTQPCTFALQCGVADLLRSWGIKPDLVVGHSIGEYAAAYAAGLIDVEHAAPVVAERGRLMSEAPTGGAMYAVFASASQVRKAIERAGVSVDVAAVNSPVETVLSGRESEIENVLRICGAPNVRLRVSHAFHSSDMAGAAERFETAAGSLVFGAQRCAFVSTVSGCLVEASELACSKYWVDQIRRTVNFSDALRAASAATVDAWLEVGPRPVLLAALNKHQESSGALKVSTLNRGVDDEGAILAAAASLHARGVELDFRAIDHGVTRSFRRLPKYAFEQKRHWLDTGASAATRTASASVQVGLWGVEWQQVLDTPVSSPKNELRRSAALVFASDVSIGGAICETLQQYGVSGVCVVLNLENDIGAPRRGTAEVTEEQRKIENAFRALAENNVSLTHTIFACGLGISRQPQWLVGGSAPASLAEATTLGSLVRVLQAAERTGASGRVWIATRRAQLIEGDNEIEPIQSMLWGFARAIDLELPSRFGGIVDVESAQPESLRAIVRVMLQERGERQLALRGAKTWVPRLVRKPKQEGALREFPIDPSAVYVVLGGTGSIGVAMAEWLGSCGARKLCLVSRSGRRRIDEHPELLERIARLTSLGVRIHYEAADVEFAAELDAVVRHIAEKGERVAGIVHAAGTGTVEPIGTMDPQRVESVLRPKVLGAVNAKAIALKCNLDFVLLISSLSGVVGLSRLAHYSASNAFLDGLARSQRAQSKTAFTSLQLGPWNDSDMMNDAMAETCRATGLTPIDRQQGIAVLSEAVAGHPVEIVAAAIDRERLASVLASYSAGRLVADRQTQVLTTALEGNPRLQLNGDAGEWRKRLLGLTAAERSASLLEMLRSAAASVLRTPTRDLRTDRGLIDQGMDSILSVEFRNRVAQALAIELPPTVIFEYPSLEGLSSNLLGSIGSETPVVSDIPTQDGLAIAIVGMGCRFPGGVCDPDSYWNLLVSGTDAIAEVPQERWNAADYFDQDPDAPGRARTQRAGFVGDIDKFDATLFGISPREARNIDPQQRMLLQVCWEAFEHAGINIKSKINSKTGVFVGVGPVDYGLGGIRGFDPIYYPTGTASSALSGRLAYVYGFRGPSISVDAACASSLVAVHLAVRSLRSGECDMAVAAGVNLIISPEGHVALSKAGMLSPDGCCRPFDSDANGYVRGEGCGVVVLKLLSRALSDGDKIVAVIKGTAMNQNGPSAGLTVPNGHAQTEVIERAWEEAGVSIQQAGYFEAHGTGTPLGDPIEVRSLARALGDNRLPVDDALIGSVKGNIGHLETAAGMAGLIKAALIVQRGQIPPSIHFRNPNPAVTWAGSGLRVADRLLSWPTTKQNRVAGVSGFGFTGTNAHVVLAAAPAVEQPRLGATAPESPVLLKVTAAREETLRELCLRYATAIGESNVPAADWANTANRRRADLVERVCIVATSKEELISALREYHQSGLATSKALVRGRADALPRIGFIFGCRALGHEGTVLEAPRAVHSILNSMQEVVASMGSPMASFGDNNDRVHDLARMCAAAEALRLAGIRPTLVAGTGVGLLAAMVVSGSIEFDDGVCLLRAVGQSGSSVDNPLDSASRIVLDKLLNSDANCGVFWLPSAQRVSLEQAGSLRFWIEALTADGTHVWSGLHDDQVDALVEIGERAPLNKSDRASALIGTVDTQHAMMTTLARLYCIGASVDWSALSPDTPTRVQLPTYPFFRERLWVAPSPPVIATESAAAGIGLNRFESATGTIFTLDVSVSGFPFLEHHRIYGKVIVPGTFHVTVAMEAARRLQSPALDRLVLRHVGFSRPMVLEQGLVRRLQVVIRDHHVFVASAPAQSNNWTEHMVCEIADEPIVAKKIDVDDILARCSTMKEGAELYKMIGDGELALGPSFRWIDRVGCQHGEVLGYLRAPENARLDSRFPIFPGLLDSAWQTMAGTVEAEGPTVNVPMGIDRLTWNGRTLDGMALCHGINSMTERGTVRVGSITVADAEGDALIQVEGLRVQEVERHKFAWSASSARDLLYAFRWTPAVESAEPRRSSSDFDSWIIVTLGADNATVTEITASENAANGRDRSIALALPDVVRHVQQWIVARTGPKQLVVRVECAELMSGLNSVECLAQQLLLIKAFAEALDVCDAHLATGFWLVTQGGLNANRRTAAPIETALWGFVRTMALEHSNRRVKLVDLDPEEHPRKGSELVEHLQGLADYPESCVRNQRAYLPTWQQIGGANAPSSLRLDPDGVYVIAGGLGALGYNVALWLAREGARRLALLGRNPNRERLNALESQVSLLGAECNFIPVDLENRQDVIAALTSIVTAGRAIRGVVHAAGVLSDCTIGRLTKEKLEAVLRPKSLGALHLHEATINSDLQFFLLFSSIGSLVGHSGQANYCAANGYLDGFAAWRRANGLCATAVNWGPWNADGMFKNGRRSGDSHWSTLDPWEALLALKWAIVHDESQITIAPSQVIAEIDRVRLGSGNSRKDDRSAETQRVSTNLAEAIVTVASTVLANPRVNGASVLTELGLDSVMALELRKLVMKAAGVDLPVTDLLGTKDIQQIARDNDHHALQNTVPSESVVVAWDDGAV